MKEKRYEESREDKGYVRRRDKKRRKNKGGQGRTREGV